MTAQKQTDKYTSIQINTQSRSAIYPLCTSMSPIRSDQRYCTASGAYLSMPIGYLQYDHIPTSRYSTSIRKKLFYQLDISIFDSSLYVFTRPSMVSTHRTSTKKWLGHHVDSGCFLAFCHPVHCMSLWSTIYNISIFQMEVRSYNNIQHSSPPVTTPQQTWGVV